MTIPVFVNDRRLTVPPGTRAGDVAAQADPAFRSALAGGQAYLTDGRGIRLDAETPVSAGTILKVIITARRPAPVVPTPVTRDLIARLPKSELHVHLDGSLRPETMIELARDARLGLPSTDPEELRRAMLVDDASNLEEFIRRFDLTVPLLQSAEAIERVAYEMVEDAARDNIRYLEIRYCPKLSTRGGLSLDQVIEAERRGLTRGERDFGVTTGIINCSLRHYDPAQSIRLAEHSVRMRSAGVVAFDLAGGEAGRMPGHHRAAFDIAVAGGLGITVHAGEAAGPESIEEAITACHAMRIGHGTRLYQDPALERLLRDRQIPIEINLTSNLQTRVVSTAADHPVRRYFDLGLKVTLCTDSWLMCGVSLTDEYWTAHRALGFTRAEIDRLILNGFESAFLSVSEKEDLVARVSSELEGIK
jgi:adenosine deaminase